MKKTLIILSLFIFSPILKAHSKSFNPLYGNISSNTVNVRVGPGTQYPISWVYKQRHWPVEAVAKHQGWYKIRDVDGEEGWIYQRFFSKTLYGLINNTHNLTVNMYKKQDGKKIILKFEPGCIVKILNCNLGICKVSYKGKKGWIEKKYIIGADNKTSEK